MPLKTRRCGKCNRHFNFVYTFRGSYMCYWCYQQNYKNR